MWSSSGQSLRPRQRPELLWLMVIQLLIATALWPTPVALAGEPPTVSEARERELNARFVTAQEHYKAKRYADALPLFREVADELNSPNALLYVARCLREMGRDVEAYDAMERTRRAAAERAQSEDRFRDTESAARAELLDIERRVARVRVSLPNRPRGAVVEVAGRVVAIDEVVVVAPGRVRLELRAPRFETIRREIDAPAGSLQTVILAPGAAKPEVPAPVPAPPPPPSPAPSPATQGGGVRIAGFAVLGVGALSWAVVIAGGVLSNDRFGDVTERCNMQRCTSQADQDVIDEGRNFELAANVAIGVGAAATVAGVLMVIFGGPSAESAPTALGWAPLPGGGVATCSGRF